MDQDYIVAYMQHELSTKNICTDCLLRNLQIWKEVSSQKFYPKKGALPIVVYSSKYEYLQMGLRYIFIFKLYKYIFLSTSEIVSRCM
jgi:hypothetical protein